MSPLNDGRYLGNLWIIGWATVAATGDRSVAAVPPRGLHRPCRAGRPIRPLVAEGRSAGEVRDRTGLEPAGTRWVHAEPAGSGVQWARAVTTGAKEPQVRLPTPPPPGTTSGGGPEFESPHPWTTPWLARDLPETMPRFATRTYVSPRGLSRSNCGNVVEQIVRRRGSRWPHGHGMQGVRGSHSHRSESSSGPFGVKLD